MIPRPLTARSLLRHLAALLFLGAFVVSLLHPYRPHSLGIDGSIFAAVGFHLNHGRVLYRDVWDHKPPLVFFLNAFALQARGEDPSSIRDLQIVFGLLTASIFYWVQISIFGSIRSAVFLSILFLLVFYSPILYGGGNFTEEYGAPFVLLGVLGMVRWMKFGGRRNAAWLFLSGVGFGGAVLAKEPFLFSAPAWILFLLFLGRRGGRRRAIDLGCFIAGGCLPALLPIAYFLSHGALGSWVEVIRYGFRYTSLFPGDGLVQKQVEGLLRLNELIFSKSLLVTMLFLLAVLSLTNRGFLRRMHYLPLFTLYWVGFDFLATEISGMFFLHYYLQMVAPILCLCGFGLAFVVRRLRRSPPLARLAVGSVFLFLGAIDFALPGRLADRSSIPSTAPDDPLLDYLEERKNPGDLFWTSSGYFARYYLGAGMFSPTAHLAPFHHHLRSGPGFEFDRRQVAGIHRDLRARPPRFILGVELLRPPLRTEETVEWFQSHYRFTPVKRRGEVYLVFELVEDASRSMVEQKKEWASEEAQRSEELPWFTVNLLRLLPDSAPQSP